MYIICIILFLTGYTFSITYSNESNIFDTIISLLHFNAWSSDKLLISIHYSAIIGILLIIISFILCLYKFGEKSEEYKTFKLMCIVLFITAFVLVPFLN